MVEEDEQDAPGAVVDYGLEDREAGPTRPDEAGRKDRSPNGGRGAFGNQRADRREVAPVLVPKREMEKEIEYGRDAGFAELGGS